MSYQDLKHWLDQVWKFISMFVENVICPGNSRAWARFCPSTYPRPSNGDHHFKPDQFTHRRIFPPVRPIWLYKLGLPDHPLCGLCIYYFALKTPHKGLKHRPIHNSRWLTLSSEQDWWLGLYSLRIDDRMRAVTWLRSRLPIGPN